MRKIKDCYRREIKKRKFEKESFVVHSTFIRIKISEKQELRFDRNNEIGLRISFKMKWSNLFHRIK